jgi:hypothetical protein
MFLCLRIVTTGQIDGVLSFMIDDNMFKNLYVFLGRILPFMFLDKWLGFWLILGKLRETVPAVF